MEFHGFFFDDMFYKFFLEVLLKLSNSLENYVYSDLLLKLLLFENKDNHILT